MRRILLIAAAAALLACGQPGAPANAAAGGASESEADYVARCTRETLAANPSAQNWAESSCRENWAAVVAAGPMADAILAGVPAPGETVAGSAVRTRVTNVQWQARAEGTLVAQGRLGDADVQVEPQSLNFYWGDTGALIPYDVVAALQGRGATVSMIGCAQLGVGEMNRAYRVEAPGRAPFGLGVYARGAPTANAESFYNVSANLAGRITTLAEMRADGGEVTPTCPY